MVDRLQSIDYFPMTQLALYNLIPDNQMIHLFDAKQSKKVMATIISGAGFWQQPIHLGASFTFLSFLKN